MITEYRTGGGRTAYCVTEPDATYLYALVTDTDGTKIPQRPETDEMMIGAYLDGGTSDALSRTMVVGRAGLIEWYVQHVGYDPDEDIEGKTPILELLDRVASIILLDLAPAH